MNLFLCRVTFKDSTNQDVVAKLIKEVQGINPSFQACHIRSECCHNHSGFWFQSSLQALFSVYWVRCLTVGAVGIHTRFTMVNHCIGVHCEYGLESVHPGS